MPILGRITGSASRSNATTVAFAPLPKFNRFTSGLFLVPLCFAVAAAGSTALAAKTKPVKLRSASSYVILTETGITDVSASRVRGNVGVSPITGAADHLSCVEIVGKVYSVDAAGPAPCNIADAALLTTAVSDMETAYTDAAGRLSTVKELGVGNIGGLTLTPAVYSWSSSVSIPASITLEGGPMDVWILQVAQDLNVAPATKIHLSGGAVPQHVFWQVAGAVTIGTTAKFEGVILSKTSIAMQTGASIHGRLLSQTAVSLQMNSVIKPKHL
jgi:hypothetical protein